MTDIITELKQELEIGWDDFLKGVKWLGKEAETIAKAVEKVDPGIQNQLQDLLKAGEAAAEVALGVGTGGMSSIVAAGMDDAETLVANFFQATMGGAGQGLSAASVNALQQASTALQAAIPVAVAKIAAATANAAQAGAASVG